MKSELDFFIGLIWASVLSIPLWGIILFFVWLAV